MAKARRQICISIQGGRPCEATNASVDSHIPMNTQEVLKGVSEGREECTHTRTHTQGCTISGEWLNETAIGYISEGFS